MAAREVVALYRGLLEASRRLTPRNLAGALTNLANRLSEVWRNELVADREALEAYRVLAEASPQAYTPPAAPLNNLANHLSEVGESEKALETQT